MGSFFAQAMRGPCPRFSPMALDRLALGVHGRQIYIHLCVKEKANATALLRDSALRTSPRPATMPELINANPTVIAASDIPSRASKTSPDPFQQLLGTHASPDDGEAVVDDDAVDQFDAQEIYGPGNAWSKADDRLVEFDIRS